MSSTYKYPGITGLGRLEEIENTIPTELKADHVLIQVHYSSLSPFDLYQLDKGFYVQQLPATVGLNASGTVVKVGKDVSDLKEGDHVAAYSYDPNNKGLQEYTAQPRSVISKIPGDITLEEAATIPNNFICGFYTLFNQLCLPWTSEFPPTSAPPDSHRPILIYGAGATSGQFAIQLLKLAKYTNVVAVASPQHNDYLHGLGAAHVVDYRSPSFVDDISKAFGDDGKAELVLDCVSLDESFTAISKVIRPGGKLAYLGPLKHKGDLSGGGESTELLFEVPEVLSSSFPKGVDFIFVRTFLYQQDPRLANTLAPTILSNLLEKGLIKPNPTVVLDKGSLLERTNAAFQLLRENKNSGKKVVVKLT